MASAMAPEPINAMFFFSIVASVLSCHYKASDTLLAFFPGFIYFSPNGSKIIQARNESVRMRNPVQKNFQRARIHSKRIWLWFIAAGVLGFCFLAACLAIVPAINPAFGAETADSCGPLSARSRFACWKAFHSTSGSVESISFHHKWREDSDYIFSTCGTNSIVQFGRFSSFYSDSDNASTHSDSGSRSTQHANTDSSCRGRLASDRLAGLRSECERRACHGARVDFG